MAKGKQIAQPGEKEVYSREKNPVAVPYYPITYPYRK